MLIHVWGEAEYRVGDTHELDFAFSWLIKNNKPANPCALAGLLFLKKRRDRYASIYYMVLHNPVELIRLSENSEYNRYRHCKESLWHPLCWCIGFWRLCSAITYAADKVLAYGIADWRFRRFDDTHTP
jgi:hypothetical protein